MPPPGTCETVRFDFTTQAHNCPAGACPRPTVAGEINNRGVSKKSLKLDVIASQPAMTWFFDSLSAPFGALFLLAVFSLQ